MPLSTEAKKRVRRRLFPEAFAEKEKKTRGGTSEWAEWEADMRPLHQEQGQRRREDLASAALRWGFDFANEAPLQSGPVEWTLHAMDKAPAFYHGLNKPYTPIKAPFQPQSQPYQTPKRPAPTPKHLHHSGEQTETTPVKRRGKVETRPSLPPPPPKASLKGFFATTRRSEPGRAVKTQRRPAPYHFRSSTLRGT